MDKSLADIHTYLHVAMRPVLHVEGRRTLLGSVVVHQGLYVFVAFVLYAFSIL
jgi:hypothetical protein